MEKYEVILEFEISEVANFSRYLSNSLNSIYTENLTNVLIYRDCYLKLYDYKYIHLQEMFC